VTTARLRIVYAGPLTTVQDVGRFGFERYGVTEGGPMDRTAFVIGQTALGCSGTGVSIEVGLGGLTLDCIAGTVTIAITGGNFKVETNGNLRPSWSTIQLAPNTRLTITPGRWGSWCYVAIAGTVDWPVWLGSQSTLVSLPVTGHPLKRNDELVIRDVYQLRRTQGGLTIPVLCQPRSTINLVVGPQERFFEKQALSSLFTGRYLLTTDFSRMAVRLEGPKLSIAAPLDMPSEGVLRGSLQVPGNGDPLVLMADHQTTGGYPKIATMISADQDAFAQLRPHQRVQFRNVKVDYAIARARTRQKAVREYLDLLQANTR
jgi:allophanate hydrolase